jgi:hypothetical protein
MYGSDTNRRAHGKSIYIDLIPMDGPMIECICMGLLSTDGPKVESICMGLIQTDGPMVKCIYIDLIPMDGPMVESVCMGVLPPARHVGRKYMYRFDINRWAHSKVTIYMGVIQTAGPMVRSIYMVVIPTNGPIHIYMCLLRDDCNTSHRCPLLNPISPSSTL